MVGCLPCQNSSVCGTFRRLERRPDTGPTPLEDDDMMRNLWTAAVAAVLLAGTALAGPTPGQKCQADMNKLAGQYYYCRQKAEGKFATTGDGAARTAALQKCLTKYN